MTGKFKFKFKNYPLRRHLTFRHDASPKEFHALLAQPIAYNKRMNNQGFRAVAHLDDICAFVVFSSIYSKLYFANLRLWCVNDC